MKKRVFAALIALIMLISSFAPVSSFGAIGDDFPYIPYLNEDNYYYRNYNNSLKAFNTDWNSMVDYFVTEISACKPTVTFDFATLDYPYRYTSNSNTVSSISEILYNDLIASIKEKIGSDFYTVGHHNIVGYMNNLDTPNELNPNKERYYPFTITLSGIEYNNNDFGEYPTVAEGKYYRISNNSPIAFNTDWDEMIEYIQQKLMSRSNCITYYFATTDEAYRYVLDADEDSSVQACETFVRDVLTAVYKKDSDKPSNAAGGDYLFKSIKNIGSHGYSGYMSAGDNPVEGNERYYTFAITLNNISYFTTAEQEETIRVYCQDFTERFIAPDATDYEKVKTIFDFVVRNTKYDWEVFRDRDQYPVSSERYTIAHSAYGALRGALDEEEQYDWSRKQSVTGLTVIDKADQGLAVCEGYSKLFYYLCVMNGIPCRIVDGAFVKESGKEKDPHEWNYVWLDDGSEDAPKWFEVDTTFSAQKSFKEADLNDYDYFLCGRENINFGWMNHQQPFHMSDDHAEGEEYNILTANVIYDYWGDNGDDTYVSSLKDYQFQKLNLAQVDALECGYVVRRSTDYPWEDDTKVALIHSTKEGQYIINIDDDGTWLPTDKHGFIYNGQPQSVYEVIIPYLDKREYDAEPVSGDIVDVGEYTMVIKGAGNTQKEVSFKIIPMDLDKSQEKNYDTESLHIQESAVFTGHEIEPEVYIVDGYKNVLVEGEDYRVDVYKANDHSAKTVIKDIGHYFVDINYTIGNNYTGHYTFDFEVTKIGIDQIDNLNDIEFDYLPESLRAQYNINTPADYFKAGSSGLSMNGYPITIDKDISVTSMGGLSGGESGRIIFTGLGTSDYIAEGSQKNVKYTVSGKYDISYLDDQYADSGSENVYFYTGKAHKPVKFDHLDGFLDQGVDYIIDSYSNNTNAGQATVVIKGINGCMGTARMHFYINKESLTNAVLSTSTSTGTVTYTLTFNGKSLAKGTDYTETITQTATGYTIKLTGINNFGGSREIKVAENRVKPTSSGNTVSLATTKYVYDGKPKKPAVKVLNSKKQAISTYYYTISYSANTNPGTAKATVKFRNGYSGTITKTFTINPKPTTLSTPVPASKAITVKWKEQKTQTTGYEIEYSTDKNLKKNLKKVDIKKNSTKSYKITKLSGKKTYYFHIRTYKKVDGKKYCSSWSAIKKATTKK